MSVVSWPVVRGVGVVLVCCVVVGCGGSSGDVGGDLGRDGRVVGSTQAGVDAVALSAGVASQEQRERLVRATSLGEGQRQLLVDGDEVVISGEQMDYLVGLAGQLDRDGGLAAFEGFGGGDAGLKARLADGMQILSNPGVVAEGVPPGGTVDGSGRSDGVSVGPRRGGLEALPPSWLEALTGSPVRVGNVSGALPGVAGLTSSATTLSVLLTLDDLDMVSGVLAHGTDEVRLGTDIDRALIARAGDIAGAASDPEVFYQSSGSGRSGLDLGEIGATLNSMLEVAGQDEVAVHDAMVIGREGGPAAVSEMPETFSAPEDVSRFSHGVFESGPYDANATVANLLAFDWDEEAGHDLGMKELLGGLGDPDTVIGQAGDPGVEAVRAGAASGELAKILADNARELVDVESYGSGSMGQVNPGVSEAAADAVGMQLIGLVGGDASEIGIDGARQLDELKQLLDLITVLNMHPDSASSINAHGVDMVNYLQQHIGENAEFLPNGQVKSTRELHYSGRILVGMEVGFQNSVSAQGRDPREVEGELELPMPYSTAAHANLFEGYAKQRPELRHGDLEPYFGDDGNVQVPDEGDKQQIFRLEVDHVTGRITDAVDLGVSFARSDTIWR